MTPTKEDIAEALKCADGEGPSYNTQEADYYSQMCIVLAAALRAVEAREAELRKCLERDEPAIWNVIEMRKKIESENAALLSNIADHMTARSELRAENAALKARLALADRLITLMFTKVGYLANMPEVCALHSDFVHATFDAQEKKP